MTYEEEMRMRNEFNELMDLPMTEEIAYRMLSIITCIRSDDEVAHIMEDKLRDKVLRAIDHPLAKVALLSNRIKFSRWCA